MSYIILRGHWYNVIVLNNSLRTMKMLSGDFSAVVWTEHILKLTIGNEGLHKIDNNNILAFRTTNFVKSKVKFSREQYSHITTFINTLELLRTGKHTQIDQTGV
jgi:hypothetical protein